MGLLDQVIGGALGSRTASRHAGGGMGSPLAMALMGLLASQAMGRGRSGGLSRMLGGLAGGAGGMGAGAGGLGALINSFQRSGHGEVVDSWIGSGQNHQITPHQLGEALGPGTVDDLSRQTGMGRDDLLSELSHVLPGVVDGMTPHGRMPHDEEMSRW